MNVSRGRNTVALKIVGYNIDRFDEIARIDRINHQHTVPYIYYWDIYTNAMVNVTRPESWNWVG